MILYRIAKQKYINDLSGRGAEIAGGRWNLKGSPVLYTSSSLALCMCEVLVHTDKDLPPCDMCYSEISIPDSCISDEFFNQEAFGTSLQSGMKWLKEQHSLAIKVPSAILPESYEKDFNVLVNPLHKDFSLAKIVKVEKCLFDMRFFG